MTARALPSRRRRVESNRRQRKTGEGIAEKLRRRIATGKLAIGDFLPPEDEITSQFGVARTTAREALRILESQGLIRIRRGRGGGGVVTSPKVEHLAESLAVMLQLQHVTIGDLYDARQLLEPQLAARMAAQHSPEDVRALGEAIERASEAAEAADRGAFGAAAAGVHEALMERSGNRTLATLSRLLHELVLEYYERATSDTGQAAMRKAVRSYRKLLRLIEEGDAADAESHWRKQMSYTIDRTRRDERFDTYAE